MDGFPGYQCSFSFYHDQHGKQRPYRNCKFLDFLHPNPNAYSHAHTDIDTDSNANTFSNIDTDSNANTFSNINAVPNADSLADTYIDAGPILYSRLFSQHQHQLQQRIQCSEFRYDQHRCI